MFPIGSGTSRIHDTHRWRFELTPLGGIGLFQKDAPSSPREVGPPNTLRRLFLINGFIETADLPARSFEREVTAFAVHDSLQFTPGQQRIQRVNNLLTPQLLADLPPITQQTEKQLTEWTEFLRWKESLIRHKARGLRYISREWRDEQLVFSLVAQSAQVLQKDRKALGRDDLVAFQVGQSKDPWVFGLPEREERRLPRLGQAGRLLEPASLPKDRKLPKDETCRNVLGLRPYLPN
jgi:hypothetical protein